MKKIAFITGATSGIGYSTSKKLAKKYSLILCGRRKSRLEKIKNELSKITDIYTLCFGGDEAYIFVKDYLNKTWAQQVSKWIYTVYYKNMIDIIHIKD